MAAVRAGLESAASAAAGNRIYCNNDMASTARVIFIDMAGSEVTAAPVPAGGTAYVFVTCRIPPQETGGFRLPFLDAERLLVGVVCGFRCYWDALRAGPRRQKPGRGVRLTMQDDRKGRLMAEHFSVRARVYYRGQRRQQTQVTYFLNGKSMGVGNKTGNPLEAELAIMATTLQWPTEVLDNLHDQIMEQYQSDYRRKEFLATWYTHDENHPANNLPPGVKRGWL